MTETKAEPGKTVWVSYAAKIVSPAIDNLLSLATTLAREGVGTVQLLLSTPGGSVAQTIAAYNLLRGLPFRLVTHNVGNVDSMGNVLFLAGDERYACPHSSFMFHGVGFNVSERTRFEMRHLREKIDSVDSDQRKIAAILAERTRLAPERIDALFRDTTTHDAAFAREHGLIDAVRDLAIPTGADVRWIDPGRS